MFFDSVAGHRTPDTGHRTPDKVPVRPSVIKSRFDLRSSSPGSTFGHQVPGGPATRPRCRPLIVRSTGSGWRSVITYFVMRRARTARFDAIKLP